MSSGPTRVASRALARALSRPLHTSGANDKAAHALNLAPFYLRLQCPTDCFNFR